MNKTSKCLKVHTTIFLSPFATHTWPNYVYDKNRCLKETGYFKGNWSIENVLSHKDKPGTLLTPFCIIIGVGVRLFDLT